MRQVFTATVVFRIADGLVTEAWRNADDLSRLFQLGARIDAGAGTAGRRQVEDVADRFVAVMESGDVDALERLYTSRHGWSQQHELI